jgi:hypothetical protein
VINHPQKRTLNLVRAPAMLLALALATNATAQPAANIDAAIKAAHAKFVGLQEGKNADYIPALAKVDPNIFGIAVVTVDGRVYTTGDITSEVSIQSISKVFTMAKVIEEQGAEAIEKNMGVDATGQVFRAVQGRRDERDGQSGRDHLDQHGERGQPRGDLEQDPGDAQRLRGTDADREPGGVQVRGRDEPAQPGDLDADVRLRPHQGQPAPGV